MKRAAGSRQSNRRQPRHNRVVRRSNARPYQKACGDVAAGGGFQQNSTGRYGAEEHTVRDPNASRATTFRNQASLTHASNARCDTVIEALESRRLLAGVIVDRVLVVNGTDVSDFIDLSNGETGEVLVHLNGAARSFRVSDFDSIRINGNLGNDHVVNS